jgi:hypothetical protein
MKFSLQASVFGLALQKTSILSKVRKIKLQSKHHFYLNKRDYIAFFKKCSYTLIAQKYAKILEVSFTYFSVGGFVLQRVLVVSY